MIEIEEKNIDGICFIYINGEIDASSSINLDDALGAAVGNYQRIVVNLKDLQYISSAGLGVFMSYIQDLEQNNAKMILCEAKEKVLQVFQILGLDQVLSIVASEDDAIRQIHDL